MTEDNWYVYAILSAVNGFIYVGMSQNVEKRVKEHNAGKTKSTKAYQPWLLIYTEAVENRYKAREREKYLKTTTGKNFLRNLQKISAP